VDNPKEILIGVSPDALRCRKRCSFVAASAIGAMTACAELQETPSAQDGILILRMCLTARAEHENRANDKKGSSAVKIHPIKVPLRESE
jgi:hypothetical protein